METGIIDAVRRPEPDERVRPVAAAAARTPATAAMWWGWAGVILVFGTAVARLGARGVDTILAGLAPLEWGILALMTAVFVYGEGMRALQRRYVPHVMRRLALLRDEPRSWYRLLAPLHALSLIGGAPGLLLRAWAGSAAIAVAVVIVRSMPEPWRGIVDFAVASALAWGTAALVIAAARGFPAADAPR